MEQLLKSPTNISLEDYWILIDFLWELNPARLIVIYASNFQLECPTFWTILLPLLHFIGEVFHMGDFNEILHPSKCATCTSYSSSILELHISENES